jgi:HK97 family phage major capsid protein
MALASAKGDSYRALERAKSWTDTPEVETMVRASLNWETKAPVAAGTTTDAAWAGPLVVVQPMVNEFLELLRPKTLIDGVEGFRKVPFNVSVPAQTGGGTYSWVGQGNAKPVTSAAFATVTVGFAKAAGIIVLTEELVKLSTPSAEETVRNEMIAGMRQFLDGQLQDPAVAAVANVNPASITNGAPTAAASGATAAAARADIIARIATFTAAELSLSESEIWMNESNAFALANSLNALGQPLFPGFTGMTGSLIMGLRARVTNVVGTRVILVHTPSILFADDGGVNIDASREASIQMDSAPSNPSDATTVLVSLWQRNLVGLKAERFISWTKARTAAVTYITAAAYTGA